MINKMSGLVTQTYFFNVFYIHALIDEFCIDKFAYFYPFLHISIFIILFIMKIKMRKMNEGKKCT